jgi:cytochrome c553
MKKLTLILFILLVSPVSIIFAQEDANTASLLPETVDLHYSDKYCIECHEQKPQKGGNTYLKHNGDFTQLCRCHGYTPGTYIHPVNVVPSEDKRALIPDDFPLVNDQVTCVTCHDMYLQCQKNPKFKVLNRRFLRGAPYVSRTTLCFRCHDEKKYTMLDPHNQLTETGAIISDKCLYCHLEKPDEKTATFKEVKLIGQIEVLCFRCHYKQSQLHPINANHLVKPTSQIIENMKDSEAKFGIILPLNYEGNITCPTCHNPHERGVIPRDMASSKGASEKYRLRLAGAKLQICVACHKDKFTGF